MVRISFWVKYWFVRFSIPITKCQNRRRHLVVIRISAVAVWFLQCGTAPAEDRCLQIPAVLPAMMDDGAEVSAMTSLNFVQVILQWTPIYYSCTWFLSDTQSVGSALTRCEPTDWNGWLTRCRLWQIWHVNETRPPPLLILKHIARRSQGLPTYIQFLFLEFLVFLNTAICMQSCQGLVLRRS